MNVLVRSSLFASCVWALTATGLFAADIYQLPTGTPELKSAGALAFGPDGILLIGDHASAAIVAVSTGDRAGSPAAVNLDISNVPAKIAAALDVPTDAVRIADLAVNPASGNVYFSVNTTKSGPAIVRCSADGAFARVSLSNVPFSRATLPNAPEDKDVGEGNRKRNLRNDAITDLAFVDGQVIVSGLSSANAPSNVRALPFPFDKVTVGSSLEIYHAAHGRVEDYAPIRTFVPFMIDGKPSVLAGFVCTPLVRFDLGDLARGEKVKGTTVAELGNRNRPLDMIAYRQGGKDYLLLANSARGVMKISTEDLEKNAGLTQPVSGGGVAGQAFETISNLAGTVQLDKLTEDRAVVLIETNGETVLKTVALP